MWGKKRYNRRTVVLGQMTLDRLVFYFAESPQAVMEGGVGGQASICPHVMYFFAMFRVVEREVLDFIEPGGMKKWILLCESQQDFTECVVMYETEMPRVNGMKDF